ncbi:cytochrome ubiquinol oxidase subunit I [Ktedonobacter sp. SOSP1-85]|uniref:cytochrome ubiquinol oxidase subunit I n=1 Tax=Ktedonobacter sp. SOSP1-85 TaxID=2778367 RepID=UPI001915E7B1|nr:cytochrome ubiquinol oxidase subunit I [Ktedonobacter sp. SOSP1-85]GHO81028.1 cytochrome ubiquinol oxidase subunit I [Ktedonobacter sp. SOSP1-85]
MDALLLARLQFASTIIYHFLFVPLTLGLSILLVIMETLYVRTGKEVYRNMTKFWGKMFLINFAMGVVTGLVQEFQFGMNWSEYSRFVGDVFGAPLAVEALLAFFMESTFLGIWVFGWDRLPKKIHLAAIYLVALASHLSAFWILSANAFMQQPTGFVIRNGRAEMTNFFALITNGRLWVQFPHVVAGGLVTGAFFVAGISAYRLLKKCDEHDTEFFTRSARIGLTMALIGGIAVSLFGHIQGQYSTVHTPMKMAAAEALWNTENPAPLSLFKVANTQEHKDLFSIDIPAGLSFMSYNSFDGKVQGLNQLQAEYVKQYGPGNYIPPVFITYWSFRVMVGAGMAMVAIAGLGLFLLNKRRFTQYPKLMMLMVAAIAVPFVANTMGWILTEMGRQPWLVFGVLKTDAGVSPNVSAGMILFSLSAFIAVYAALAVVDGWLLVRTAKQDVPTLEAEKAASEEENVLQGAY